LKSAKAKLIVLGLGVGVSLLGVAAVARELGAREARHVIAEALGLDTADRVHIKLVSVGAGGEAVVEATVTAAFHMKSDKSGKWVVSEVRTGDRNWESLELIETAVKKEKILRTTADMRTLAAALEAFRKERGTYVPAKTGAALVDNLAPAYLDKIVRLDAWSHEFQYDGTEIGYRLTSLGPDGKSGTGDEIVIENGKLVKGGGS
jgi:hypothetical protein